jgi:hypothetical protein
LTTGRDAPANASCRQKTKTVSLNPRIDLISYKNIQPGFWFPDGENSKLHQMPTIDERATRHRAWWRRL